MSKYGRKKLGQYRITGHGFPAGDLGASERVENGGIPDVFPIFHTRDLGKKSGENRGLSCAVLPWISIRLGDMFGKVRIVVDEQALKLTALQLVSGVIYVQLGDFLLPSQGWYDLCASVLSMWLFTIYVAFHDQQAPFRPGGCNHIIFHGWRLFPEVNLPK